MSAFITALVLTAAATGYTVYSGERAKSKAEDQTWQAEKNASDELAKAKKAEVTATDEAKKKSAASRLALETGGRDSTFATSAFGLTAAAPVKKKKLGE